MLEKLTSTALSRQSLSWEELVSFPFKNENIAFSLPSAFDSQHLGAKAD
jgi:hypothetical protein